MTQRRKNFPAIMLLVFSSAISDFNKYILPGAPRSGFNIDYFQTAHFSLLPNHSLVMADTIFHQESKQNPNAIPQISMHFSMGRSECFIQAAQDAMGYYININMGYALPAPSPQYFPRRDRNAIARGWEEEFVTITRGRTRE